MLCQLTILIVLVFLSNFVVVNLQTYFINLILFNKH